MNAQTEEVAEGKHVPTRDELRAELIGKRHAPTSEVLTLFGQEVELRQPTLQAILEMRDDVDEKSRTVQMLLEYTYVPGTDELLFEKGDTSSILAWPFGTDLVKVQVAIARLTGVDISAAEDAINEDPLSE